MLLTKIYMKKVRVIQLSTVSDSRGCLSFFEEGIPIPFEMQCAYWMSGEYIRQGCAYKKHEEFIVALAGNCDILVDNGKVKKKYMLTRPSYGLYIPELHWVEIGHFSKNCLLLVVSSCKFYDMNYIYNYDDFSIGWLNDKI